MLWEVEISPKGRNLELERVLAEYDLLTHSADAEKPLTGSSRGYILEGDIDFEAHRERLAELLVDAVAEDHFQGELNYQAGRVGYPLITVLPKPGVTDPVAQTVLEAAATLGVPLRMARTFRRYVAHRPLNDAQKSVLFRKVLANDAIEQVVEGAVPLDTLSPGRPYQFRKLTVRLRELDDDGLARVSRDGQLALTVEEMRTIQVHFRDAGRDPTDIELETFAQTWSEHCSHKTLKGRIDYSENGGPVRHYGNLLKETIFAATAELRARWGADDWCVSVFADNAGVVKFTDEFHLCFKVETHNHPSAVEPYGGANTGLGGVIRDPLGTGLGARPVCNTDVFCFAPPDTPPESLPPGVLHPRKVMSGVVAGVRDYGNRMGIPTVNGAIIFDERYLANPLVYCGTVGLIPVGKVEKEARPGDRIVAVGGRTGRDGIHGATFSSLELTAESESVSGGAVQIGNAVTEKKVLDVLMTARDRGLYRAITDCGAGGFSSAVGEMAAEVGATVHLDRAPLKYEGLSYTEIWISEAQERMVLAVPPEKWPDLQALCQSEDVEAADLGEFEATGRLKLFYAGELVGDLDLHALHEGRPGGVRQAFWHRRAGGVNPLSRRAGGVNPLSGRAGGVNPLSEEEDKGLTPGPPEGKPRQDNYTNDLLAILSSPSVCSKESVVRQYDHEVQGGSVVKPMVGVRNDGPGDASVVMPVPPRDWRRDAWAGFAVGCGINPLYGDLDPAAMAASAIDEAVRNVVAVGADPARVAILDNFCWGDVSDPAVLGELVRAAAACKEVAVAYGTPFVSGKDSLNNTYRDGERRTSIPGTLLISALGLVPDVRKCVTMDLKAAGNDLYLVGHTRDEMGGSHWNMMRGQSGGSPPRVELATAPAVFAGLHRAIVAGLVRACHDCSEGGLAVALAEMAFAGEVGADVNGLADLAGADELDDATRLFSESNTRFVVEVEPANADALRAALGDGVPLTRLGRTVSEKRLRVAGVSGKRVVWAELAELKKAWQKPLRGW